MIQSHSIIAYSLSQFGLLVSDLTRRDFSYPRLLRFDEWCTNRATGKNPKLCFVEIVMGLYPSTGIPHEHILSHNFKLNDMTIYRERLEYNSLTGM